MADRYFIIATDEKGKTHDFFVDASGKVWWSGSHERAETARNKYALPVKQMSIAQVQQMGGGHGINHIKSMSQMEEAINIKASEVPPPPTDPLSPPEPPKTPEELAQEVVEETIDSILETVPEPPIPYDEANPWAFDEYLARLSAEEEYIPYYSELLEDFLESQGALRERGSEDLERSKVDIEKALAEYMEASGIRSQRNLEDFEEYGETIEERRDRLESEKARGLEEYRIAQERNDITREAYLQEQRIMEGRLSEDELEALKAQGVDVERILKMKEDYESAQAESKGRATEDLQYWLSSLGIQEERAGEDLLRGLKSLGAEKESFMSSEERAWKEAVEQANEGFAGRGLFLSGIRGDTLGKMGVERSQIVEDYMRGYQENVDTAEISTGRALQDIARQRQQTGVEYTREIEDLQRAIEEYGQKAGWSMEDIELAKTDIQQEAARRREDIATAKSEYERQHEYQQADIQRAQADMLRQMGYEEEDIDRLMEQYTEQYGRAKEDISTEERLRQEAAARGIEEGTIEYQRLAEDLARQEELMRKETAREQEAAILGGVQQRRGEYQEEYEAGRELYYLQMMYPEIYGEPGTGAAGGVPAEGGTEGQDPRFRYDDQGRLIGRSGFDVDYYDWDKGQWYSHPRGYYDGPPPTEENLSAPELATTPIPTPAGGQLQAPTTPIDGYDVPGPDGTGGYFGATTTSPLQSYQAGATAGGGTTQPVVPSAPKYGPLVTGMGGGTTQPVVPSKPKYGPLAQTENPYEQYQYPGASSMLSNYK